MSVKFTDSEGNVLNHGNRVTVDFGHDVVFQATVYQPEVRWLRKRSHQNGWGVPVLVVGNNRKTITIVHYLNIIKS